MVDSFQTHGDGGPQSVEIIRSNVTRGNRRSALLTAFSHKKAGTAGCKGFQTIGIASSLAFVTF
jgi:hypothetical protein